MNITVIGGGNIGTVLLGELAKSPENRVSLLTSRPEQWHHTIEVIDSDAHTSFTAELTKITSDSQEKAAEFPYFRRFHHLIP